MTGDRRWSETITLLGGLVTADGECIKEATLRPLTGYEEEWLDAHPGLPAAQTVTELLSQCLQGIGELSPTPERVRSLLVGDRDWLMLHLRRITLGDALHAVLHCPACDAKMDVDFAVSEIPVEPGPQTEIVYAAEGSVGAVRFRLPTGFDQEEVAYKEPEAAVAELLRRCVIDSDGAELPESERETIIEAMDRLAPQIDLDLDLACPECGHTFTAPFDTTAFFLEELRAHGRRLLREVHELAFHYHWSEDAILGLTRVRRRAYLALIRDSPG